MILGVVTSVVLSIAVPASMLLDSDVPIVVACAFAGLVILVLYLPGLRASAVLRRVANRANPEVGDATLTFAALVWVNGAGPTLGYVAIRQRRLILYSPEEVRASEFDLQSASIRRETTSSPVERAVLRLNWPGETALEFLPVRGALGTPVSSRQLDLLLARVSQEATLAI